MARAPERGHLTRQLLRVVSFPAVGDDQHDRAASNGAPDPPPVQFLEARTNPGSSVPVHHLAPHPPECQVRMTELELAGDSGESSSEDEYFEWGSDALQGMGEA